MQLLQKILNVFFPDSKEILRWSFQMERDTWYPSDELDVSRFKTLNINASIRNNFVVRTEYRAGGEWVIDKTFACSYRALITVPKKSDRFRVSVLVLIPTTSGLADDPELKLNITGEVF